MTHVSVRDDDEQKANAQVAMGVIQGRDVTVVLPPQVTPAMADPPMT